MTKSTEEKLLEIAELESSTNFYLINCKEIADDIDNSEYQLVKLSSNHDLIIALGDCEFYGSCACGKQFGMIRPDESLKVSSSEWIRHVWEHHVMTETTGYPDLGDE